MKDFKIEICVESPKHALTAQQNGADRVELCTALSTGGLTPSAGNILQTRQLIDINLHVLIRPRTYNFVYDESEFTQMLLDIDYCKKTGVNGIVTGLLTQKNDIDFEKMEIIREKSYPLALTFHRAFDVCLQPKETLKKIIALGADYLLTSGQQSSAEKGKNLIKDLCSIAKNNITILPGGGINEKNISDLMKFTSASEFHFSCHIKSDKRNASEELDSFMKPGIKFDVKKLHKCIAALSQ